MTSEVARLRNDEELRQVATKMAQKLLFHTKKLSSLLSYVISLLEVFKKEIQRNSKLGYCDYELAFVCYQAAGVLCKECEKQDKNSDLVKATRVTYNLKNNDYATISAVLEVSDNHPQKNVGNGLDLEADLLARFQNLKSLSSDSFATKASDESRLISGDIPLIDYAKFKGCVTASELHDLIRSFKILLIDFRASKDHNHNHINYPEIVNIEPSQVNNLIAQVPNCSDVDLEQKLSHIIPDAHLARLKKRTSYDLVVIYNFNFGPTGANPNRFDALCERVIAGSRDRISSTPFDELIDILMFRNKFPGHTLSRYPCYLAGGVSNWFEVFGKDSITRTIKDPVLQRPPASFSREGSTNSIPARKPSLKPVDEGQHTSPYLKNFGDYLSTVKSGSLRPVEPSFSLITTTQSVPSKASSSSSVSIPVNPRPTQTVLAPKAPSRKPSLSNNVGASYQPKSSPLSSSSSSLMTQDTTTFLEQYTTGLTNLGNSCYMNCILQCLGATPQLTGFFFPSLSTSASLENSSVQSYRQHINVNNRLGTKGILTTNFVTLLKNMFASTGAYFTPLEFKRVMGSLSPSKQFATYDQQDCIEFLEFLLDRLHEDLNQMVISDPEEKRAISELTPEQEKTREILPVRLASTIEWERYLKLNFSIIVDFFQGQYSSQLRCLICGATSTTYNAFLILSLPIPTRLGSSPPVLLLDDCLDAFVTTELLDDDNKWFCPQCKKRTKLTKKLTITRLPQVLIVHFKRFKISPTGQFSKLDTFIKYPVNQVLDLTSYWPPIGTSVNESMASSEVMLVEREQQVLSTLPTRNQVPPFRYKLFGVANHFGNLTTGHYTSYVRKKSDAKKTREWCYFDDSKVTYNCKESQVLNKNAYCLFYQRI